LKFNDLLAGLGFEQPEALTRPTSHWMIALVLCCTVVTLLIAVR
jgi:hypothetical protein